MPRARIGLGAWGEPTYKKKVSIATVEKDGRDVEVKTTRWIGRCHYRDEFGTYSHPQVTAATRPLAVAALMAKLTAKPVISVTRITRDSPFNALVDERLKEIDADSSLAESTKHSYSRALRQIVRVEFGQLTIREATTARLNAKVQEWVTSGRTSRAYEARMQVHACLRLGVQLGVIDVNPAREMNRVSRNEAAPRALTDSELKALFGAANGWDSKTRPGRKTLNPMSDVLQVLAMTGCRIGEVLALRFQDVDWSENRVTICGTVEERNGQRKPQTKSKAGMRTIHVPDELILMLSRRRDESPSNNPHGAVFVTNAGTWLQPSNVRASWRRIRKDANLEWVEFRNLRVTVGTRIANAISPKAAAQVLGHSSEAITRKHYMDKSHEELVDTANVLAQLSGHHR